MKICPVSEAKIPKIARNRCITLRASTDTLAEWTVDCKINHKTLSETLNEKVRTAFQILFSAARKGERPNARN